MCLVQILTLNVIDLNKEYMGFPDSLVGKESTCNAEDPGSSPGSERSSGEGIDYVLQAILGLPWCSTGKESACNVGDLGSIPGLGRSLEEGMATHSSILAWKIHSLQGHKELDMAEGLSLLLF